MCIISVEVLQRLMLVRNAQRLSNKNTKIQGFLDEISNERCAKLLIFLHETLVK